MNWDSVIPNVPKTWTNNRLHFFKYMSEHTAKIVLRNQTLRWSTAATLNDPFEMQLQVSIDHIDTGRAKQRALENMWRLYSGSTPVPAGNLLGEMLEILRKHGGGLSQEEFLYEMGQALDESFEVIRRRSPMNQKEIMERLAPIKILSLTVAPDIILMWSHYANAHRGVVMRFKSIPILDSPYGLARPIHYTDVRPSFFDEEYLVNSLSGLESLNTRRLTDSVIYTKMSEWSYEQEWRVSLGEGRNKLAPFEDLKFGNEELDGIIFGLRTPNEDRVELQELCAGYANVELMQAVPIGASGKIGIQQV